MFLPNRKIFLIASIISSLLSSNVTFAGVGGDEIHNWGQIHGSVIGRDLDIHGLGWVGHVGIIWSDQVSEVLNNEQVINGIAAREIIGKPKYWGIRSIFTESELASLIDPNINSKKSQEWNNFYWRIINAIDMQRRIDSNEKGCIKYTAFATYDPPRAHYSEPFDPSSGNDYYKPHGELIVDSCGYFRCDTYVNYIMHEAGVTLSTYNPPTEKGNPTFPLLVYNSFQTLVHSPKKMPAVAHSDKTIKFTNDYLRAFKNQSNLPSINTITFKELDNLPMAEFMVLMEKSIDDINDEGRRNIIEFTKNKNLSIDKKILLMDAFRFLGKPEMFTDLINIYKNANKKEELPLRNQIMDSLQGISEAYLKPKKYIEETRQLKEFYLDVLMKTSISSNEHSVAERGFILYSSDEELKNSLKKLDAATRDKIKEYILHTPRLY